MPAFDDHRPPDAALVGDCVHCGFCLPTCPTYVLWGEEMDSPARPHLPDGPGLEGEPLSDSMVGHFDACLGCMACVTACPSGVQYDKLIEATRAQVERATSGRCQNACCALRSSPLPATRGGCGCCGGRCGSTSAAACSRCVRRSGLLDRLPAPLRAMEALAPPLGRGAGSAAAGAVAARGHAPGRRSGC